jgi:hypothetical protein
MGEPHPSKVALRSGSISREIELGEFLRLNSIKGPSYYDDLPGVRFDPLSMLALSTD